MLSAQREKRDPENAAQFQIRSCRHGLFFCCIALALLPQTSFTSSITFNVLQPTYHSQLPMYFRSRVITIHLIPIIGFPSSV